MDEIYRNSVATIYTYIYVNGDLTTPDVAPTVSIFDVDTGEELVTDAATNTNATGVYYYTLPTSLTTDCKTYRAEWTYTVGVNTVTSTNEFTVVVPYTTLNEVTTDYSHLASLTFDDFKVIERRVRRNIDAYTRQSFAPLGSKAFRIYGTGANHLTLPERIYELEYVAHEDPRVVLYDTYTVGGMIQERDDDGVLVTPAADYAVGPVETVTWDPEAPWVIRRRLNTLWPYEPREDVSLDVINTRHIFGNKHMYLVRAKVGWERVPAQVNQAARLLFDHYLSPESAYNEKGVDIVRATDYRLEFTESPYETTGNVHADRLLADYINMGWHLF